MPAIDIYRRYPRIMQNIFTDYLPLADQWHFWDASKLQVKLVAHSSTMSIKELQQNHG